MSPNKIYALVLAATILTNAGCSGARLRNLISRNDYKSIDELNQTDEFVTSPTGESAIAAKDRDNSLLVADQRDAEALEGQRDRRFSITRLFRNKSPEAEFAEDPFAEPLSATVDEVEDVPAIKTVSAIRKSESDVAMVEKTTSSATDKVEKKSEQAFADAEKFVKTNPFDNAGSSAKEADVADVETSYSFEDLMARRQKLRNSTAEKSSANTAATEVSKPDLSEQFASKSPNAPGSAFDFDSLIEEPAFDKADFAAGGGPESQPFPELDNMISAASEERESPVNFANHAAENAFNQAFIDSATNTSDSASQTDEDPFSLASQKHGFGPLGKQDPWAAFASQTSTKEVSWETESTTTRPTTANEFAWEQPAVNGFDNLVASNDYGSADDRFMQVASTSTVDHDAGFHNNQKPSGLVIPFQDSPNGQTSQSVEVDSQPSFMDDPFFSATDANELSEVPDFAAETDTAGSAGGPATILGAPTRTLFFILGCAILAILLFLPNRQKQNN